MSLEEKQRIIEAWDEHMKKQDIRFKFLTLNATQEEKFDVDFRENVLQSRKLSNEEKDEILQYVNLWIQIWKDIWVI